MAISSILYNPTITIIAVRRMASRNANGAKITAAIAGRDLTHHCVWARSLRMSRLANRSIDRRSKRRRYIWWPSNTLAGGHSTLSFGWGDRERPQCSDDKCMCVSEVNMAFCAQNHHNLRRAFLKKWPLRPSRMMGHCPICGYVCECVMPGALDAKVRAQSIR